MTRIPVSSALDLWFTIHILLSHPLRQHPNRCPIRSGRFFRYFQLFSQIGLDKGQNTRYSGYMSIAPRDKATDLARIFLEPANSTHRQYEALRAYFVDGVRSAEAARRFGYSPGSFRVLSHQFRQDPHRPFFLAPTKGPKVAPKRDPVRQEVIALRKQNLSIYDISKALARSGHRLSPAAVAMILKEEGFARLPRRRDDDRPQRPAGVLPPGSDLPCLVLILPVHRRQRKRPGQRK